MGIEIIKQSKELNSVDYYLDFYYKNDKGSGFCFPCNKNGEVNEEMLEPAGLKNWKRCQTDSNIIREGIRRQVYSWVDPPIGRCDCGKEIELGGFTNTCEKCGKDYNWNGQLLAPREQWGEETGEHWSDCY